MFNDQTFIDNEAKLRVDLVRANSSMMSPRDGGRPVKTETFQGKLQFPGTLNLNRGLCSMIFMSKEGREELQLSGVVPHKRSKDSTPSRGITNQNELIVRLNPFTDRSARRGFVGEIEAPTFNLNAERGVEFTVHLPVSGKGEMLIGQLNNHEDEIDEEASLRVDLFRAKDAHKRPFYRGKVQFPGNLNWELGARLKVVTTPRAEELRINIIGPPQSYRSGHESMGGGATGRRGRLYAPLRKGRGGIYEAELDHPGNVDLDRGLYFTIFTNQGREEIQIARIDPALVRARQTRQRWPAAANG